MSQSELEVNTTSQRQARENACQRVTIGFGLFLIGSESGAFFKSITKCRNVKPK